MDSSFDTALSAAEEHWPHRPSRDPSLRALDQRLGRATASRRATMRERLCEAHGQDPEAMEAEHAKAYELQLRAVAKEAQQRMNEPWFDPAASNKLIAAIAAFQQALGQRTCVDPDRSFEETLIDDGSTSDQVVFPAARRLRIRATANDSGGIEKRAGWQAVWQVPRDGFLRAESLTQVAGLLSLTCGRNCNLISPTSFGQVSVSLSVMLLRGNIPVQPDIFAQATRRQAGAVLAQEGESRVRSVREQVEVTSMWQPARQGDLAVIRAGVQPLAHTLGRPTRSDVDLLSGVGLGAELLSLCVRML